MIKEHKNMKEEEKEWRVRPYYKSELAEAYAPYLAPGSALNRRSQRLFTSRQVALIFEYLGEP